MEIPRKKLIQKLSKHSEVLLAYLFGSQAQEKSSKNSDIDIAILLKEPIQDSLQSRLDLLQTLHETLGENADLTLLNHAGSVLKYQVVKHGKLLFEKQKGVGKKFQINAWKEFFDFQPTLNFFYKRKIA